MASPIDTLGDTLGGSRGPSQGLGSELYNDDHLELATLEDPGQTTELPTDSCSIDTTASELMGVEGRLEPGEPTGDEIVILFISHES
jgi:hypothetical protein